MPKLSATQIKAGLARVPEWKLRGKAISRTCKFKDFRQAMRFVRKVATLAEVAWHHPDIKIQWNKVTLTLTTHSEGGLTAADFTMAGKFDRIRV